MSGISNPPNQRSRKVRLGLPDLRSPVAVIPFILRYLHDSIVLTMTWKDLPDAQEPPEIKEKTPKKKKPKKKQHRGPPVADPVPSKSSVPREVDAAKVLAAWSRVLADCV